MREQRPLNARQPANEHRRVLGANSFVSKFVCRPLVYAKSPFVATSARIVVSFFSTDKAVVKLMIFLKFSLSSCNISQVVSLSRSFQVVAELKSQNTILKVCRNYKTKNKLYKDINEFI